MVNMENIPEQTSTFAKFKAFALIGVMLVALPVTFLVTNSTFEKSSYTPQAAESSCKTGVNSISYGSPCTVPGSSSAGTMYVSFKCYDGSAGMLTATRCVRQNDMRDGARDFCNQIRASSCSVTGVPGTPTRTPTRPAVSSTPPGGPTVTRTPTPSRAATPTKTATPTPTIVFTGSATFTPPPEATPTIHLTSTPRP